MIFTGWDTPLSALKTELVQKEYEGFLVPDTIKNQVSALDCEKDTMNFTVIDDIWTALDKLPPNPKFPYVQPNDLETIRAKRPKGVRQLDMPAESDLLDKFHGAWIGRAAGCALGKPVEAMGIRGQQGMTGRKAIQTYLQNRNEWPLNNYFSGVDTGDDLKLYCPLSQREQITFMEPDDDIHYTLIALRILEEYGPDFEWRHVAHTWNNSPIQRNLHGRNTSYSQLQQCSTQKC
jgi:hypothetical protein